MERLSRPIADFSRTHDTARITPSDTVERAIEEMRTHNVHCVYVVDGATLVGLFTERDFVRRVASKGANLSAPVSEFMTANPEVLRETDDIRYAINKMAVGGYRNVPVVDDGGALIGSLGVRDVVAHLSEVLSAPEYDDADSEWVDIGGG